MFPSLYQDKRSRLNFKHSESFLITCTLLKEVNFTPNLPYFLFKRQITASFISKIRNRCVLTARSRAIHSKFRCSRIVLNSEILQRNVPGFYRAV